LFLSAPSVAMSPRWRVIVVLALLLWPRPASAEEWPVLFIHGFCSSAETWNATLSQLSTRRYGDDAPRYYEGASGKAVARSPVPAGARTFLIDFSDLSGGFEARAVADVPVQRKAGELKIVVNEIKRVTGAHGVILVGHSLGGLVARAYMQGIGVGRDGKTIPFGQDVPALVMISTPNQGSPLANVSGQPGFEACALADTANLRDLQPASALLMELNRRAWPANAEVHSIVSNNAGRQSDDVVTTISQDLTAIPRYAVLPEAKHWLQSFQRDGILHTRVHGEPTTVALLTGIISDVDALDWVLRRCRPCS
jgi:pimeloyl-ACP methyl ester carboxylesterase